MLKEDWLKLPEEIQMFVAADTDDLMDEIGDKFSLSREQKIDLLDLLDDVFLKKTEVLYFPQTVDKMPGSKNFDVRLLVLDIAYKILWPLQDYLVDVDKLIFRLGGKVPRIKPIVGKIREASGLFPGGEEGTFAELANKYNDFKELRLSANKIIDLKGRKIAATVDNWIKDYIHFAGAGVKDPLKRAQYLSKEKNPLLLNEQERESLRLLLVSYDEGRPMRFEYQNLKLSVSQPVEDKTQKAEDRSELSTTSLDDIFGSIEKELVSLEKTIISQEFILSEAEGQLVKVRDILWNALALSDQDKVLSCLRLLAIKKSLDALFREDNRFRNILRRFIGVKFGQSVEKYLDSQPDNLILRRLFLEMIFKDKLRLSTEEAAFRGFYLSNFYSQSDPVVYLDKKSGRFQWRQLGATGGQLDWQDKV
ncbi:MAG: hypothetical protein PHO91_04460 [Patescibacteria group bacterium]|nr:hypothetical protein [Patescibacteria group bacterium]